MARAGTELAQQFLGAGPQAAGPGLSPPANPESSLWARRGPQKVYFDLHLAVGLFDPGWPLLRKVLLFGVAERREVFPS